MSQAPTTNETGSRMFALEKAMHLHTVGTAAATIVADAKTFLDFIQPASYARPTIVPVRG